MSILKRETPMNSTPHRDNKYEKHFCAILWRRTLKRNIFLTISIVSVLVVIGLIISIMFQPNLRATHSIEKSHFIGGFAIDSPTRAENAANSGVQATISYNNPPTPSSPLGKKLLSSHMRVIDGYLASDLYYYECHRTWTVVRPPNGQRFCGRDKYTYLANEKAFLADITKHLQLVRNNPLVVGYWVLDDWVAWDAGSARPLLMKVNSLVHQYTPNRPTICGLGGTIHLGNTYSWNDGTAANFSPQGCDRVGLYLYTSSMPNRAPYNAAPYSSPDKYNWAMNGLLTKIFASLKKRGWDSKKEPIIGITQAFGGIIRGTSNYYVTPTAQNLAAQSKSFCEHGASGIAFYGWDDSSFGPGSFTPMNSSQIQQGIQQGITACKAYWQAHPTV